MIDETQRRDPPTPVRKELYEPGWLTQPLRLGGPPRTLAPHRKKLTPIKRENDIKTIPKPNIPPDTIPRTVAIL